MDPAKTPQSTKARMGPSSTVDRQKEFDSQGAEERDKFLKERAETYVYAHSRLAEKFVRLIQLG